MNEIEKRHFFCEYLLHFVGQWYKWGGDVPGAFDCSGLICEGLKAVGKIGRGEDLTAMDLYERFADHSKPGPERGRLVFFGAINNITHVEACITNEISIGAAGGGSKVLTVADAVAARAFIKVRPIYAGRMPVAFVDPFAVF